MSLAAGARIGPYQVTALLGEGGMGEVWRAHHTALNRDDALKVLPEGLVNDPERLARFRREAQVLASLNHPNIAHVYGFEQADGRQALVMELVEGPTLADRIAQGPIPIEEALRIARQIAEAVEGAHEQGIVHRDLKPANIKLRSDGTVKVLDFGLAKVLEPAAAGVDATASPTITSPAMMTGVGVLLGTAAYMSPEQAKGRPADKRSDIWAFGGVLYEMLTGRRAFEGDDVADTLAFVLTKDPEWNALPVQVPRVIHKLLRRCLAKDRRQRLSDIAAARLDIDEALNEPPTAITPVPRSGRIRERLTWAAIITVIVTVAVVLIQMGGPDPAAPELRVDVATPSTTDPLSLAISPDGRKLVFAAMFEGRQLLWLRELDSGLARPLPGTDDAATPFWSPDNRSVGFFVPGTLRRIDIESGSIRELGNATGGRGGTWNTEGTIVYAPSGTGPLVRVPDTGGEPVRVTVLEGPQGSHRFPQFLPDGRHFLHFTADLTARSGVYIGQLDGSPSQRILDSDSFAVYAPSGHLLFVRGGTLFAQRFDPVSLTVSGQPVPLAEKLPMSATIAGATALSASTAGSIVYRTDSSGGQRPLIWFDRSGKEVARIGSSYGIGPMLSPDGRRVAFQRGASDDVWVADLGRGVETRFTLDAAFDIYPVWSPDSSRIVFSSNRGGSYRLFQKAVGGTGSDEPIAGTFESPTSSLLPSWLAMDWSSDGQFLLYLDTGQRTGRDIWALPLAGDRKPFAVVQTEFDERNALFSPDGRWIAYQSNESGTFEVYVQAFPGPGRKQQISSRGGAQVRWRRDGRELFYVALDGQLMAVGISVRSDNSGLEAGTPIPLFATRIGGAIQTNSRQQYDVSSDGQRFLMSTIVDQATSPISVILNWKPEP